MECIRFRLKGSTSAPGNGTAPFPNAKEIVPFPVRFLKSNLHKPIDISIKELALKKQLEQLLSRAPVETKGYKSLINLPDQ